MDGRNQVSEIIFHGLMWKHRIRKTKGSYSVCIPTCLVKGNYLEKGDAISQFAATLNGKNAVVTILDKNEPDCIKTAKIVRNTSIIKTINTN